MVDVTKPGGTAARAAAGAAYAYRRQDRHRAGDRHEAGREVRREEGRRAHRDHALFIAFAPADEPKIAIGILVENGGHGSATAAPIARKVFDYYLLGKLPEKPPELDPDAQED